MKSARSLRFILRSEVRLQKSLHGGASARAVVQITRKIRYEVAEENHEGEVRDEVAALDLEVLDVAEALG